MTRSDIPNIPGYKDLNLFNKQGGMGTIYHGYGEETGEEVIIKLMKSEDEDYANNLRRFTQETYIAKILGAYKPEHVLSAIAHGEISIPHSRDVILYLVYPYIKNGALSNLLREEPWHTWSLLHIADVIIQAAEGLFYLHKHGVVHQDVKPSNFLWSPANPAQPPLRHIHIWLIDFGAAALEGKTEFPIGTPGYVAPEQADGEIRCSADQYALAVMARLLLTGCQPPQNNYLAPALDTPLSELNPERLHEQEIDRVVLKALAQRPEDRFGSVLDFARALRTAILQQEHFHEAPTDPAPPSSLQQHDKPSSPHRASTEPVSPINPPSPPGPEVSVIIPPIPSPTRYQRPMEVILPFTAHRPVPTPNSAPSLPTFPLQKPFTVQLPSRPTMLAWSPDGTALVCTFYQDAPRLIHDDQRVEILSGFEYGHCVCWSPNSRFLAISICNNDKPQAEIRFWDRTAPKERYQPLQLHNGKPIYGLDWSRTEHLALWLESELLVYNLSMLSTHTQLPIPHTLLSLRNMQCGRRTALRWSPDGAWLAAGANNGKVICWSPPMPTPREQQPFTKSVSSMSWSPDSTILATAFVNKQVMFWNLHSNSSTIWEDLPEMPAMISISPQTSQVAIATQKKLFFGRLGDLAPTASHPGQMHAVWSPTNKLLATLDQNDEATLVIWQA